VTQTSTQELESALAAFETSLSDERRQQLHSLRRADDSYDTNAAQKLVATIKQENESKRGYRALLKI